MKNKGKIVAAVVAVLGVGLAPACSLNKKHNTKTPESGDVTEKNWTVRFDSKGGSSIDDTVVKNGNKVSKPVNPTKEGFTFIGWYTNEACTNEYNFNNQVTASFTLYAKWQQAQAQKVTVSFDVEGTITSQEIELGTVATKPTDPTKTGYDFVGWYVNDVKFDFATAISTNTTLTAKFEIKKFIVSFNTNGAQTIDSQTINYNTKATKPTDPSKEGYEFDGWYLNDVKFDFNTVITANIELTAKYNINKYTVSFNSNGGSAVESQTIDYNNFVTKPTDPTKTGYEFKGWYKENTFNNEYVFTSNVTSNITLYAKWQANPYTISFNTDGGNEIADMPVIYDQEFTLPTPTKTGYNFAGWYNGSTKVESGTWSTTSNISLIAHWTIDQLTVRFNANGGNEVESQSVDYGASATYVAATRTGYDFKGWYTDSSLNNEFNFTTVLNDDLVLYAKWQAKENTITFNTNGGNEIEDLTVTYDSAYVLPTPTKTGYEFDGWYNGSTKVEAGKWTGTEDITLSAQWTANKVTVSFNSKGGSSVDSQTIDYNTKAQDTSSTKLGYQFKGWYTTSECNDADKYDFDSVVTSNITLYAKWQANEYKITFNTNGGEPVEDLVVTYNEPYILPTTTKTGHKFGGWFNGNKFENGVFDYTSNITVEAIWTIDVYTVSFNVNGGSAIADAEVNYNSKLTEPAAPEKNQHQFAGWYTDAELSNEYNFNTPVTADLTLYAKWTYDATVTVETWTVTLNTNNGETATIINVEKNTVASISKPTKTGYDFEGWYTDALLSNKFDETSAITQDTILYANWNVKEYTVTFNSLGGSNVSPQTINYNEKATYQTTSYVGYDFKGWYTSPLCEETNKFDFNNLITGDITLYAKWEIKSFTIEFNSNGGSSVANQTIEYNDVAVQENPTKTGYIFKGWYLDQETFNNKYNFATAVTESLTLYAKWQAETKTIAFDTDGGNDISNMTVTYDQAYTLPTPTKTGYNFAGWYNGSTKVESGTWTGLEDIALKAHWDAIKYDVVFNTNGGSEVTTQKIEYNASATKPANPTKTGYKFAGWYSNEGLTAEFDFTTAITSSITLYASWEANDYTVSFNSNGGSAVAAQNIKYNNKATKPADPSKTGYKFVAWYSNEGLTTAFDFTNTAITQSITLYAKWDANPYTITFDSNGGNEVADLNVTYDAAFILPTPTKTGHQFDGWYNGSTKVESGTWTTASSMTLTAHWTADQITITIDKDNGEATSQTNVSYGEKLSQLDPPTKTGYTFVEWRVNNTAYNFNSTVTTAFTITAIWSIDSYTITFNSNGGSAVTAITQNYNTDVTAPTAPTRAGYDFEGWYTDTNLSKAYTFSKMTESITLYAKWTELYYTVTYVTEYSSQAALEDVNKLPNPLPSLTYTGYTFKGWYMENTYQTLAVAGASITDNTTLYAKWVQSSSGVDSETVSTNMVAYIDSLIDETLSQTYPWVPKWNAEGFKGKWNYIDGVFLSSVVDLYRQTGTEKYKNFLIQYVNYYVDSNGNFITRQKTSNTTGSLTLPQELDTICESKILFDLYQFTADSRYLKAIETTYQRLITENIATGTPCYEHKSTYSNQIWLDGFYMYVPFYARYALFKNDSTIFDTIKSQYQYAYEHMVDSTTGLLYHGYDATKSIFWADSTTGTSQSFWLRSNGWYIASLVDVLDYFPEGTNKEYLKGQLQSLMTALMKYQDADTKMFYQVINGINADGTPKTYQISISKYLSTLSTEADYTERATSINGDIATMPNYLESSGSSIIAYVAMKGARKGYLASSYLTKGIEIYEGIYQHSFKDNKLNDICVSAGLGPSNKTYRDGTPEYYIAEEVGSDDAKGTGPFIMAYLQYGAQALATNTITYVDDYLIYEKLIVDNNSVISQPVITEREGYTFDGWYTSNTYTELFDFTKKITSDVNVYGKWSQNAQYSITYNINGHGTQPENVSSAYNLPSTLPTLAETGYKFGGWYTDSGLTTKAVAGATLTQDTILYAKWTEASSASTYILDASVDSLSTSMGTDGSFSYDGNVTYESSSFKFGSNISTTNYISITITGPATISFTAKTNTANKGKLRISNDTKTYDTMLTTSYANYYVNVDESGTQTLKFSRGDSGTGVNVTKITIETTSSGSTTTKYSVTYNINGHGTQPEDVENVTALPSTLPTLEETGYTFGGWYTNSGLTTAAVAGATITQNTTLYAKWTSNSETNTKSITMNGTSYDTIAAALAAISTSSTSTYKITLGKGTYEENGLSYNGKATVIISGNTTTTYGADVIIKGHGSDMTKESDRNLISFKGSGNIILENLTLESDWSRADHAGDVQAEVLGTDNTGYTAAYNCSFKSHQDTIRTAGKAWFYGCYIEGDVDFLWMEQAGKVALYENCEIVSVYDSNATNHSSYITAPRMTASSTVGKGLVIYNSTITEQDSAQKTYLARTPWTSGYYNQVAYINTTCTGIESSVWYGSQISTSYDKTIIGWKMDQATATSLGYSGNGDIISADTVSKEFNGRKAIINRMYNTTEGKYEKDTSSYWDIDALLTLTGWEVSTDTSTETVSGDTLKTVTTYMFDRSASSTNVYSLDSNVQNTSLTWQGLTIDASSNGKFAYNGSNSYQFNSGTKISFSVPANSTVEVIAYQTYYAYTVNGAAATATSTIVNMTSAGTIEIVSTGSAYLVSIVITTIENNDPQTFTVSFNTLGGSSIADVNVTEGDILTAPSAPTKSGYTFGGWYTNSGCTTSYNFNNTVTNSFTLYAKWTPVSTDTELTLSSYSGYTEGIYATFPETNVANATVAYSTDGINYTNVDKALIRQQDSTTARVDVVGLTSGTYTLKVTNSQNKTKIVNGIYVNEDDRSGYAHFNREEGIGAYNNDGTLKSNAVVVYIDDSTKNTQKATIGGTEYTGLVNIINGAISKNIPLDMRLIGKVSAATWNVLDYNPTGEYSNKNPLPIENVIDVNGNQLPKQSIVGDDIKNYNSMSNDIANGITELNGLTNKILYSSGEFDSYFNMCDVKGANNITIEGIGSNAEIYQWGFEFIQCNSIEVKNLTFSNYTEDAVGFEGSSSNSGISSYGNYWLHNCTFNIGVNNWDVCPEQDKKDGDGSSDIKRCHSVTIAYCQYNHTHKTNLIGANKDCLQYNITLHHNYYNSASQRLPLVRQSNIHMYNNYYYNATTSGISIRSNSFALIENNTFESCKNPLELRYDDGAAAYTGMAYKALGNTFTSCTTNDKNMTGDGYPKKDSYAGFMTDNVTSRTDTVTNKCKADGSTDYSNFDTSSTLFYYKNGQSDVMLLETAAESKQTVLTYAGVLKDNTVGGPIASGTTYTVSYVTNNGTTVAAAIVKEGRSLPLPTTLTKSGYVIEGWYTEASFTNKVTTSTAVTSNMTVYANWVAASTITLNANDLTAVSDKTTADTVIDSTFTLTTGISIDSSSKSMDGYSFTQRIKLNGTGSSTKSSIKITVNSAATITVYGMSSSKEIRNLGLFNSSYSEIDNTSRFSNDGTAIGKHTFSVSSAGTYYLGSLNSGFNIYAVIVNY